MRFRVSSADIAVVFAVCACCVLYWDFRAGGPVADLIWALVGHRLLCPPVEPPAFSLLSLLGQTAWGLVQYVAGGLSALSRE